MNRTALLTESRAKFLQAFMDAADHAMGLAAIAIFRKADRCFSQVTQRRLLDAHRVFTQKQPVLRNQLLRQMDQLLNRSFQTAYSAFRPAFIGTFNVDTLSLVDTSHFEGQLKIDSITTGFRNAASVQLRDLNIRMAILFEQETIKERENPFRPWLFTRAIAAAAEGIGEPPQIAALVSEQLAESIQESIAVIYKSVNTCLADGGIAAQLQLKVERSRDAGAAAGGGNFEKVEGPVLPDASPTSPTNERFRGFGSFGTVLPADQQDDVPTLPASFARPASGGPAKNSSNTPTGELSPPPMFAEPFLQSDPLSSERGQVSPLDAIGRLMQLVQRNAAGTKETPKETPKDPLTDFANFNVFDDLDAPSLKATESNSGERLFFSRLQRFLTADIPASDAKGTPDVACPALPVSDALKTLLRTLMTQQVANSPAVMDGTTDNRVLKERLALEKASAIAEERMTIDIIAMVFEFVLTDHRTPPSIRAEIGRMQLPILKIALEDATFLQRPSHPARELVNRIGTITFGLGDSDQVLGRIIGELRQIVSVLYTTDDNTAEQFDTLLHEFNHFIDRELHHGQVGTQPKSANATPSEEQPSLQAPSPKAEQQAESTETAFSQPPIRLALESMLNEILVEIEPDPLMGEFLTTVWMDIVTEAEETNHPNAFRFRSVVPDLLWSISPRNDIDSRAKLVAKLPILVRTIRDGLGQLGWSAERQQPLLDWLVELHRNALRGNAGGADNLSLAQMQGRFAYFLKFRIKRKSIIERAADAESGDSINTLNTVDTAKVPMALASFPVVHATVFTSPRVPDLSLTAATGLEGDALDQVVVEQLRSGAAVEFELNGAWGTARTDWSDQVSSTLTLRIEGHNAPSSISLRTFKRTLKSGRLLYLKTVPLFERAIDAVRKSIEAVQRRN